MAGNANSGPPSKLTPEVEAALISAAQRGMNITKRCQHARVTRQAYYYWIEHNHDFLNKIERAETYLARKSEELIASQILDKKDPTYAKWYLERRDNDYKNKTQTELSGDVHVNQDEKLLEVLESFIQKDKDDSGEPNESAEAPTS